MQVLWQMQKFMCYCKYSFCFVLFYFIFKFDGNFQVQAPGDLHLEGQFNGGFFALRVWGGLFSEFYGIRWRYTYFLFIELPQSVQSSSLSSSSSSLTLFMGSSCSSFLKQSTTSTIHNTQNTISKPSSTASMENVKRAESTINTIHNTQNTISKPSSTASMANVKKAQSALMPIGLLWSYFLFRWYW